MWRGGHNNIIFETIITVHIIWLNIHHYTIQYTAVV